MSFGFGVGDFITVIQIASDVYGTYRDAPGQFKAISDEVSSLKAVLVQAESIYDQEATSEADQKNLRGIADGCTNALKDAEKLLQEFNRYERHRISRAWRRVTWDTTKVNELRDRFGSNTTYLTAFNSGILV